MRSDWILGTCEQDGQVDKKGRRLDRSSLGEKTFRQNGAKQDEMTSDWEMRQREKAGVGSFTVGAAWLLLGASGTLDTTPYLSLGQQPEDHLTELGGVFPGCE